MPSRIRSPDVKTVEKELSDEEFEYYSRQLALSDIGYSGQVRLKNSRVCILGCGGLGVPAMLMLTAMGVGHLRVVDRDIISKSDLHRQYLYDIESVGRPKVEVAAKRLRRLNPNITVEPLAEPIMNRNVSGIVDGADAALDALDSMETRYLVNRACQQKGVPYIFAGAIESIANASTIIPGETPCLECIFPSLTDSALPKCSLVGVHPAVIGVISSVQVYETVAILTGKKPQLAGRLLLVSLGDLSFEKINISKQESCPVCGSRPRGKPRTVPERYFEEECARDGRRTFILTPKRSIQVDLNRVLGKLREEGVAVKSEGELGISFDYPDCFNISLLKSGTMVAQIAPSKARVDLTDEILSTYRRIIVDWLGVSPETV
ncbi:HesA/MoeB/ThiF family protein, partial [Candidatus Bathyarchaeota archaeon]|nr:HesA/MoeB/ThiF family protein [Candidatus Bathyarchaeota archaeon]